MKVLLIDVDSKIPNLALMKVSHYYRTKGYDIDFKKLDFDYYPKERQQIFIDGSDYFCVWVSIIFPINKEVVKVNNCDNVYFGGTGYDLSIKLDEDIDNSPEDYSLYPDNDTSYGFITRGCIRNCSFCFVPRKEGMLKAYRTPEEVINPKFKKVIFMDNNFLAWEKCEETLEWLRDHKVRFQFNQGLDIRLINDKRAKLLSECNYFGEILFAFDDLNLECIIKDKLILLKQYFKKNWKFKFYIYCNADMPIQNVLRRIEWCSDNMVLPYLMRDINCWSSPNKNFYTDLCAWCNQPAFFKKMSFEQFMLKRTNNVERICKSTQLFVSNLNQ
jgi:hypothetical protein